MFLKKIIPGYIKLENMIAGEVEKGDNVAGFLNNSLGDVGIGTLKMLPCSDSRAYGYCEFIDTRGGNNLTKSEAKKYYQQAN